MKTGTHGYPCGCFLKVYVCPGHIDEAAGALQELTDQLQLPILDTKVSVSALEDGRADGALQA